MEQSLKEFSHGQQLFVNHQTKGIRGEVQFTAKELLHFKGAFNNEVVQELAELDVSYAQRRINSGGCADLLAVTLFLDGLTRR
ncbi:MAG: triphosphoribosyl-dephospho-CoA synthase [Sphaerochaeta sp.]|nr:triphosphoribosyl-dephospho-CoA synthase [Sphaerochaeta sp.]